MSCDVNQSASLWCWECHISLVLWGKELLLHLAEKHEIIFWSSGKRLRKPTYYVEHGPFEENYQTYHQCLHCGQVMKFTEVLVRNHFDNSQHTNISLTTFNQYLPQLVLRDTYQVQIRISHNYGSWDDILNMLPSAAFANVGLGNRWDHGDVSTLWLHSQQLRIPAFDNGMEMERLEGQEEEENDGVEEAVIEDWVREGMGKQEEEVMEGLEEQEEEGIEEVGEAVTEDWVGEGVGEQEEEVEEDTLNSSESIWPPPFSTGVYQNEELYRRGTETKKFLSLSSSCLCLMGWGSSFLEILQVCS